MNNRELIEELSKIGKLPTSETCDEINFPLGDFDDLLRKFTLPIDFDTAVKLVNLSPPVNESCYEIEWALVHLVETVDEKQIRKVLDNSKDGEVKRILQIRLDNFNKKSSLD